MADIPYRTEVRQQSGTAADGNVASSTSSVILLSPQASRTGFTVFNDSTATLYLKLGPNTASSTSFTIAMAPGSYFEDPFGYTGQVVGIWASANGAARVVEFT